MKWIITLLLAAVLQLFLPWWSIAIAAFVAGLLIKQKAHRAFLHGFLGIFLLWTLASLWVYLDNEAILAGKLADLLFLPHSLLAVLATGLVGGITGGCAGITGHYLRQALQ